MSLLSKLTLVIPTYHREPYALRNMRYWSGSEVTVHVLDGGEEPISAEEMAGLTDNINYHHMPISWTDRIAKAADMVETKYAAMLCDDELYLPDALEACIQELESDESLVACSGRCLGFQLITNQVRGYPAFSDWENYSVPQDDPVARMIHHMDTYTLSTIYAVVRTPVWNLSWAIVDENKQYPVYGFADFKFELAASYLGKSKIIPNLMRLISNENNRVGGGYVKGGKILEINDWWVNAGTSADREEFLTTMASTLCSGDIGKLESVKEGLTAAINQMIESGADERRERLRRRARGTVRAAVTTRLPTLVKAPIKKVLAIRPDAKRKPLLQAAKELESTGVQVNFEQFSQIAEIIQQFHVTYKGLSRNGSSPEIVGNGANWA